MRADPRVATRPFPDGRCLVRGEVIADQVDIESGGHGLVDGDQELLELHRAVPAVQL